MASSSRSSVVVTLNNLPDDGIILPDVDTSKVDALINDYFNDSDSACGSDDEEYHSNNNHSNHLKR